MEMVLIYTMEYYSDVLKTKSYLLVNEWNMKAAILNEIIQIPKRKLQYEPSYMWILALKP